MFCICKNNVAIQLQYREGTSRILSGVLCEILISNVAEKTGFSLTRNGNHVYRFSCVYTHVVLANADVLSAHENTSHCIFLQLCNIGVIHRIMIIQKSNNNT